jgi:hypothetical protein
MHILNPLKNRKGFGDPLYMCPCAISSNAALPFSAGFIGSAKFLHEPLRMLRFPYATPTLGSWAKTEVPIFAGSREYVVAQLSRF